MIDIEKNKIYQHQSTRDALAKLNLLNIHLTLFVLDANNKMLGTVTDGDIRRGLLNGLTIDMPVSDFMFRDFRFFGQGNISTEQFISFKNDKLKIVPVLDANRNIVEILDLTYFISYLPLDVLLMAGGEGIRLRPLTEQTPKPLLPVGGKPLLDHNMQRLKKFGIKNFNISVRYLAEKIEKHIGSGSEKNIRIKYLRETTPLGTIGCAGLIKEFNNDYLLVMNADLLTDIDFEQMYLKLLTEKADMIVATIPYTVNVPYGVIETDNDNVTGISEKPSLLFNTNAGIYIIHKKLLSEIPYNTFFNATDLLTKVIEKKHKLIYYPIHTFWLDIGRIEDYNRANEMFKFLQF
ncbi:MAG TPA: nucleotidyltransferase family protein [Bacteroidia bacterium]|nr:nucleotidyltransferase family protein [Bacteroidia bacterium]